MRSTKTRAMGSVNKLREIAGEQYRLGLLLGLDHVQVRLLLDELASYIDAQQ